MPSKAPFAREDATPPMNRPRVYIAGPLSCGDRRRNLTRAAHAAHELIAAGFAPLCPQLTDALDPTGSLGEGTWLEVDVAWLTVSEAVLRLPGESPSSDSLVAEARARGIAVVQAEDGRGLARALGKLALLLPR